MKELPFYGNGGDDYCVIASGKGYEQAEVGPFRLTPSTHAAVDLMLLQHNATFNFGGARWEALGITHPGLVALVSAGATSIEQARSRYEDLLDKKGATLACFLNLTCAMGQVDLEGATPLSFIRELIWDDSMQQDRFFAWAEPSIIDRLREAVRQGEFSPEQGCATFHPGATCSFKQTQFQVANVQLTFHEDEKAIIDGVQCVKIEPDIDYYKDLPAHGLLEVLPNKTTGSITNPRQVFKLRWMAGRLAGLPEFAPPYVIE
ncbi:MAG: hypothetical protein P4K98_04245 [Bryobacteraceae bacterium]|nr:hypothetical protein [Bryobacteraceae bacterium]